MTAKVKHGRYGATGDRWTTTDEWVITVCGSPQVGSVRSLSWGSCHDEVAELLWRIAKRKLSGHEKLRCVSSVDQYGERSILYTPSDLGAQAAYDVRKNDGHEVYYELVDMRDGQRSIVAHHVP